MSEDFKVNDLVWAKMKGYPPWPAKIKSSTKQPKSKKALFVQFFGDNKFAWIPKGKITPHSQSILNNLGNKKSASYQKAIAELLTFLKSSQKDKVKKEQSEKIVKEEKEKESPKNVKGIEGSLRKSVNGKKVAPKRLLNIKAKEEPGECTAPKNQKLMSSDDPLLGTPPYFLNLGINNVSVWETDSVPCLDSYVTDDPGHCTVVRRNNVSATMKRIGFIGLGNIGRVVVHNLLKCGYDVTVWNRTTHKCESFVAMGANVAESPADIITSCYITFCSVADPDASKAIVFGDRGILKGLEQAQKLDKICRGYIEMSSIDAESSKEFNDAIVRAGGKYLEAPICGDNTSGIIIIAAGDKKLFYDTFTFFHAVVKHAHFISCSVGFGSQISLLLRMLSGTMYAAVAEVLGLATSLHVEEDTFLKLLGIVSFQNMIEKCRRMMNSDFKTVTPLKHVQKQLNLTLLLGNQYSRPMPVTAAANQFYERAKSLNLSNLDVTAVYQALTSKCLNNVITSG